MTSDRITEQAARAIENVMALDRRALHDPSAAFGKSFFVRRGDVLAILSALAHQAPATERSCPTCGCDERYPTAVHIVDCPIESAEVGPVGDRFFERIDGRGYIERVHSHHSGTARVLAADDRYREVTIQAPATEEGHVPNGDPPPKPSDYVDPGNPPVLYWRHKKYPTMLSWAYDLHADGQPYRLDLDSAWQRVKLVPVEPGE